MKILWMGMDTSPDVPIGNNLIRRQPEFKGEFVRLGDVPHFVTNDPLDYDLVCYWGGIANHTMLKSVPIVKQRSRAKIACLLRATGSGISGWRAEHQADIINTMPLFDVVFTPHWDHKQYLEMLGVNVRHLAHAIDFSKYPSPLYPRKMSESARFAIGTGGMEAHRGFFWSAVLYKMIKDEYPDVSGSVVLPERELVTTKKFVKKVGLKDVTLFVGGSFEKYIKFLNENVDIALMNLQTTGNSRTLLDYSVLQIPVIHPLNVQATDDPWPMLSVHTYSSIQDMFLVFKRLIEDREFYPKTKDYANSVLNLFSVDRVVQNFKNFITEVLEE